MYSVHREGVRGVHFRSFLGQLLRMTRLKPSYIALLLDSEGMRIYNKAFTHKSVEPNPNENYEYLEFLGDSTANKAIVSYVSRKYPNISNEGVLTRIKISLVSKRSFAQMGRRLHFTRFITAHPKIKETKIDQTLEDVFEAFIGATEWLVDRKIQDSIGYCVCYDLIKSILDTTPISLNYEDLVDAKTRLKETFDLFGSTLGRLKYTSDYMDSKHYVTASYHPEQGAPVSIGKGFGYKKADAEQRAAKEALSYLKQQGYSKPVPEQFLHIQ